MHEMSFEEAEIIAKNIINDTYPPINPAVLLRAGYEIYMKKGGCKELVDIVNWLSSTLSYYNCENA
jgi:hypothetical protein